MDPLQALREGVELAPENSALRAHLARTLLSYGHFAEAASHFRQSLKSEPGDDKLKIGLARAFLGEGKSSEALVIVEGMHDEAEAGVIHARLLLQAGDPQMAARRYRAAIDLDPDMVDQTLSQQLGVFIDNADEDENEGEIVDGRIRASESSGSDDAGGEGIEIQRSTITFDDVGGMDPVKEQIRMKIIHPMQNAELFKSYGKKIGGGVMLYGPPGCGKTYLARATAGEVNAKFISVGIHDVVEMWIGQSERNLHDIFQTARRNAPCVLFFDEVDALGAKRSDMRGSAGRHVINQFLSELDGDKYDNDGLLILAATNAPWHVDSAFRRPGRFGEVVFVPPPDGAAREAILRVLMKGKPQDDMDYAKLASVSKRLSGADLKGAIDRAVEAVLADAMKTGSPQPLRTKDLAKALKKTKPSTKEWLSTAQNYARYANEGGSYDEIQRYLDEPG